MTGDDPDPGRPAGVHNAGAETPPGCAQRDDAVRREGVQESPVVATIFRK